MPVQEALHPTLSTMAVIMALNIEASIIGNCTDFIKMFDHFTVDEYDKAYARQTGDSQSKSRADEIMKGHISNLMEQEKTNSVITNVCTVFPLISPLGAY